MASGKQTSRSLSREVDSDGELVEDSPGHEDYIQPGRPGRKKNPNSQAARRDQNRIAQREFRLRKQQRIRDLEARVEMLSGSKDETYLQMREIINELIHENQTLRNIVRGLSGFIGEGAGGFLPRIGWSLKEFEAFINRADTDTAFEAFTKTKRARQEGLIHPSSSSSEKRPSLEEDEVSRKRTRTSFDGTSDVNFSPPSLGPQPQFGTGAPAMELYSGMRPPPMTQFPQNFLGSINPDQQQHGAGTQFLPPPPGPTGTNLGYVSSGVGANGRDVFHGSYTGGPSPGSSTSAPGPGPPIQNMSYLSSASSSTSTPPLPPTHDQRPSPALEDVLEDSKAQEARKLVGYHLDNYRRNSAYCLPPSLRPTLVQRTIEHESIVDGIPHPELRNRMILLRGRFDLAECIHDYLTSTIIHGDDVLAHANWEIQESWLKKYGFLVDPVTLGLTNRWRKERGDTEIPMSAIAPNEQLPGMTGS